MVPCQNCGKENALGRVFCDGCGSKLDLSAMSSARIAELTSRSWLARNWKKFLWLIVLALVAVVAMALWPKSNTIGLAGTVVGSRRVEAQLGALRAAAAGQSMTATLSERDINGYLAFNVVPSLGFQSISIDAQDGYFFVRAVRGMGMVRIRSFHVGPKLSYELACVPIGGGVAVRKATLGHLSLVGPARMLAVKALVRAFSSHETWRDFERVTRIEAGVDSLSLAVGR